MLPYVAPAAGNHLVMQSLRNPDLMGTTDFLLSTLSLAHAATKEQDAACAPACNSQYSQLMQSC